ncbi:MAG: hypothetical protein QXN59_00615 [Candidatus Micrarchaeaceae archaeon]
MIPDTSSIIFAFENKKNIFDIIEQEFVHPSISISRGILRELNSAASNKGRKGAAARAALLVAKAKKLKVYNNNGHVDAWIVGIARSSGGKVAIVTNDVALAKRLAGFNGLLVCKVSREGKLRQ